MKRFVILSLAISFCLTNWAKEDQINKTNMLVDFHSPPQEYRPWVYWFFNNGNLTKEGTDADLEAMHRVGIGGVLIMEVNQGAPKGSVDFMSDNWRAHFKYMINKAASLGIQVNMNNGPSWNGSGGPWIKPEDAMKEMSFGIVELSANRLFEKITLPKGQINFDYYQDICVLAFPTPKAKTLLGFLNINNQRINTPVSHFPAEAFIPLDAIIDLTEKMNTDGEINRKDIPAGNYTVIRFGVTCKNQFSHPAPEAGEGLECDKLSKRGIEATFNGQIAKLLTDNREHAGTTFVATHVDSWENGSQNWSDEMSEEFLKRRKYDVLKFLPIFAGFFIENPEYTDRFLWDFRRTVSELVLENYAGRLKELTEQNGLRFTVEAYLDHMPCDALQYAGITDEPMGEFWINHTMMHSCRAMASAGHIYGKNIIGAESLTAGAEERWLMYPGSLKTLGDVAFTEGINRFVFHRYSFQPWKDVKPGMMMGPWGIHYERTQTWWELTPAWHTYLTRCQYLLRQGDYTADILYLEPEDSPQVFTDHPRNGYQWDQGNTDVVLKASVIDKTLVLPSGMRYKVMVLPPTERLTPELLEKTQQLVQDGLTVVGDWRPKVSPSLTDYPNNDQRIKALTQVLWGNNNTPSGENRVGKGKIVWGKTPEAVLREMNYAPDFESDVRLNWIHRRLSNAEVYFVANPFNQTVLAQIQLRESGIPELWDPETGETAEISSFQTVAGTTRLTLGMPATKSVFIVLKQNGKKTTQLTGLTKDGQKVFDLKEKINPINIISAQYGILNDPGKTVDVTRLVEQLVAAGERRIIVDRMMEQQNTHPAGNAIKSLTVDYEMNGKKYTVTGKDSESIVIGTKLPPVKIHRASFHSMDILERLQNYFDRGENNFPVQWLMQSGDPVPFEGYYPGFWGMSFDYTMNEKKSLYRAWTWSGVDGNILLEDTVLPPPAFSTYNSSGKACIDFLQSGNYVMTFISDKKRKEKVKLPEPFNLNDDWTVDFPHQSVKFDHLISWSESPDESIRFFSGTATYVKSFSIPKNFRKKGLRLILDLGQVEMIAQLELNGIDLGVLWKIEKSVDITDFLKSGNNSLKISVTNGWPNRLIGDAHLPPSDDRRENGTLKAWPEWLLNGKPDPNGRSTFCMWNLWKKDEPLIPSGLIGPVRLLPVKRVVY